MERTDYLCPLCEGEGDRECYCRGSGLVTEKEARDLAAAGAGEPRQLPAAPLELRQQCGDCAFREDSPEWESLQIYQIAEQETPFHCHMGMHATADGRYQPLAEDANGRPVGHPLCVGWLRARRAAQRAEERQGH